MVPFLDQSPGSLISLAAIIEDAKGWCRLVNLALSFSPILTAAMCGAKRTNAMLANTAGPFRFLRPPADAVRALVTPLSERLVVLPWAVPITICSKVTVTVAAESTGRAVLMAVFPSSQESGAEDGPSSGSCCPPSPWVRFARL